MPELPDITVYCEALRRLVGQPIIEMRVVSPFVVRTYDPPPSSFVSRRLERVLRIGKRIALGFEQDLWCVVHLMIAGRLQLLEPGARIPAKRGLIALDFEQHSLLLTEAGTKRRASVHLLRSEAEVRALHRGGLEPLEASLEEFQARLLSENRTLKRALCDPRLISGIGNAYSDEILFWAELSPVSLTRSLSDEQWSRLYVATRRTLTSWTTKLQHEAASEFPTKVTAFRPEMAVHGKFRKPCPRCRTPIARIRYAANETNYCPRCQTGGKLLADRSLSRLLKNDWPKSIDDLSEVSASSPAAVHPPQGSETRPRAGRKAPGG